MTHEWKTCRCTECQDIVHSVEAARAEGATEMREKILALAKQFNVPSMSLVTTMLRGLALPEKKFK